MCWLTAGGFCCQFGSRLQWCCTAQKTFFVKLMFDMAFGERGFDALGSAFGFPVW